MILDICAGKLRKERKREQLSFLQRHFNFIEAIRHNTIPDKTTLKNITGVAWATLQNALEEFTQNHDNPICMDNGFSLNHEYCIFAGISIGATQIKLCFLDFCFNPINKNFFYNNDLSDVYEALSEGALKDEEIEQTDSNKDLFFCYEGEDIRELLMLRLKKIIQCIKRIDEVTGKVLSIGISLPGIIDKKDLVVNFSPNIKCLRMIHVKDLISDELWMQLDSNGISVFFEHDTQAASIFEKEFLYKDEVHKELSLKKNICCVYIAAGMGGSIIYNNMLLRGTTNSLGEFGHMDAPNINSSIINLPLSPEEEKDRKEYIEQKKKKKEKNIICECGKINCLENSFREDVFGIDNIDDYLELLRDSAKIKHYIKDHPYRYMLLKEYISRVVGSLINIYNPDLIIFSGRIIWEIPELKNELNTIKTKYAIGIPAGNCKVTLGSERIYSAAAGAAISSYHSIVSNESFPNIVWKF